MDGIISEYVRMNIIRLRLYGDPGGSLTGTKVNRKL